MTERAAMLWCYSLIGILAAVFAFDMVFGPYVMRRVQSPEMAFVFGGIYAAIAFGPLILVALKR